MVNCKANRCSTAGAVEQGNSKQEIIEGNQTNQKGYNLEIIDVINIGNGQGTLTLIKQRANNTSNARRRQRKESQAWREPRRTFRRVIKAKGIL